MKIIFFGSTTDSVLVLSRLDQIICVVTQPPRPVGRKQIVTPTPVEEWAKKQKIPVLSFPHQKDKPWLFENEQTVIDTLQPFTADLLISACFGQKIPIQTIRSAKLGGLNVHPSLLPKWKGADPVPWAILAGDHQTGVTIVTLEERFDEGKIIAQQKYPITDRDTSDEVRSKLFEIGAELLVENLLDYSSGKNSGKAQKSSSTPFARRLTRKDGFISWEEFHPLLISNTDLLDRKLRAFSPWPGIWTVVKMKNAAKKRLKLIALKPSIIVQLEGKKPVPYEQFAKAYLPY
jgi:methionyl-tRNA formyltransferase